MHLTIGLDVALNRSGLVVLDNSEEILSHQLISVKPSLRYYDKLSSLYDSYCAVFTDVFLARPKNVSLVLEGRLRAGWNGSTLASIEGARVTAYHAFVLTATHNKCPITVVEVDPNDLKLYIAGKRNANKEEVRAALIKKLPSVTRLDYQEDVYDAVAIAVTYLRGSDDTRNQKITNPKPSRNRRKSSA